MNRFDWRVPVGGRRGRQRRLAAGFPAEVANRHCHPCNEPQGHYAEIQWLEAEAIFEGAEGGVHGGGEVSNGEDIGDGCEPSRGIPKGDEHVRDEHQREN